MIRTSVRYNGVAGRCANSPGRGYPRLTGGNVQDATCSIDGCESKRYCRGWCIRHYNRWHKHGDPTRLVITQPDDLSGFWAKVDVGHPLGCWLWTGGVNPDGYATVNVRRVAIGVHRLAYEQLVGAIPDGLHIDHLCRVPRCVNPDHLEPVTHQDNNARGYSPSAKNARKTTCIRGHELTLRSNSTARECKTCKVDRQRERRREARK